MQDFQNDLRVYELGYTVMKKLLVLKDYVNKNEVLAVANIAYDLVKDDENVSSDIKEAYKNAISRFNSMTWDEIMNIKKHL